MFLFSQICQSDLITNCAERMKGQCIDNGSCSSDSPLKVTILGSKWGFQCFDASFFSQELANQLAKIPEVKVRFLVPKNSCSETDKRTADSGGVTIVEVEEQPGFDDPTDWLLFPPQDLTTDIVIGVGGKLGKMAQVFKKHHQCRNIFVASNPQEDKEHSFDSLKKCNTVGICELSRMADLPVSIGPKSSKMSDELSSSLRYDKKDLFSFTPGILSGFSDVKHASSDGTNFRIVITGSGNPDNFDQEGLNTAAKAVAELKDKSYHLLYVGAAKEKHQQFVEKFGECGISKTQLTIRSFAKAKEELRRVFCEADLAIMPSTEQGFGMTGLAALSSGLPVLVHEDSGFGEALKEVNFGTSSTVDSEDAEVWGRVIKTMRKTERGLRLQEAASLRSHYDKKYSWEEQCRDLVQRMLTMVSGMNFIDASYLFSILQISINYSILGVW